MDNPLCFPPLLRRREQSALDPATSGSREPEGQYLSSILFYRQAVGTLISTPLIISYQEPFFGTIS